MNITGATSPSRTFRFRLNLANLLFLALLIATGLIIQGGYHFGKLADDTAFLGLNRHRWSIAHKAAAVISLAGIAAHCARHLKFISAGTKKKIFTRFPSPQSISWYLVILWIAVALTAMASWTLCSPGSHHRFMLVEIHDKLALLFVPLSAAHIASRLRRMAGAGGSIRRSRSDGEGPK